MESSFGTILHELSAFDHVVPSKFRSRAKELAAVVLVSGRAVDADRLSELIDTLAPQHRSAAYAVVSSLRRAAPKVQAEVVNWARVLLVFRSGKPEEWEAANGKRFKHRRR